LLTPSIAQIALRFWRKRNMDGTVVEEKDLPRRRCENRRVPTSRSDLERLIRAAGASPWSADTLYRPIDRANFPPSFPPPLRALSRFP